MPRLTEMERFVLKWLAQEDFSLLGECKGAALNKLVALGLANITNPSDYGKVYLTDKGQQWAKELE